MQNGRQKQKNPVSWVVVALVAAVLVFLAVFFTVKAVQYQKKKQELAIDRAHYEAIKDDLESYLKERSEDLGRELTREEKIEIARDRFGLVYPDEILFIPDE